MINKWEFQQTISVMIWNDLMEKEQLNRFKDLFMLCYVIMLLPSRCPNSMNCSFSLSLLNFSRSAFWTFLASLVSFTSTSAVSLNGIQNMLDNGRCKTCFYEYALYINRGRQKGFDMFRIHHSIKFESELGILVAYLEA